MAGLARTYEGQTYCCLVPSLRSRERYELVSYMYRHKMCCTHEYEYEYPPASHLKITNHAHIEGEYRGGPSDGGR